MDDDELREAAEALRAELPGLVDDAAERAAIEADLARALDQPSGTAHDALRKAIASRAVTREWMRRRAQVTEDPDRAIGLLGPPTAVLGVLFVCPKLDYSEVRETVTDEVLLCPNDGSVLERQDP
jgi:precorrin isomerase